MPRWVDCKRATFKYGLGDEFINILKVLHTLGLDRTDKVRVKGVEVSPARRGRRRAARPGDGRAADEGQDLRRPLGHRQGQGRPAHGRRTSTTSSTTSGRCRSTATSAWSGRPRSTRSSPSSCWRTAPGPGPACSGPEAFDAVPFLDLLTDVRQPVGSAGARPGVAVAAAGVRRWRRTPPRRRRTPRRAARPGSTAAAGSGTRCPRCRR